MPFDLWKINKLENAWQSLAYSPLGTIVSPPANTNETSTYWLPPCLAPPLLLNVPEVTTDKISTQTVQILMSQTPGSQNRISPNFYKMYRNNWWLLCCSQNCDPPIRFQAPTWRMKIVVGRIAAKIARFNSVNSEITWRKFTKFGYDVPWIAT